MTYLSFLMSIMPFFLLPSRSAGLSLENAKKKITNIHTSNTNTYSLDKK